MKGGTILSAERTILMDPEEIANVILKYEVTNLQGES
jgi:hypothetical protein